MHKALAASSTVLLLAASAAQAQSPSSAVGRWKTIDDATGKAKSVVEVYVAKDGRLAGKLLAPTSSQIAARLVELGR